MKPHEIITTINSNSDLFTQGTVIPEAKILGWFNIKLPDFSKSSIQANIKSAQRFQFQKLGAQSAINKILATRGMYMSQANDTYIIKNKAQVKLKIKQLKQLAKVKKHQAAVLQNGLNLFGCSWN